MLKLFTKLGVLLNDPGKVLHYLRYSATRFMFGHGVARIPFGGEIKTSSFSEYLSVYGLMPGLDEQKMVQSRLTDATTVFDIGANVGVWSVLMSKANPAAKIHSFEPNPATFSLLEKNVHKNGCANVSLNNLAASDHDGSVKFQVPKSASIFGRVLPSEGGVDDERRFSNASIFEVKCTRLLDYCKENSIQEIDFMKIDVEGYELGVLKGLGSLFSERKLKALYIETMELNHIRMGGSYSEFVTFINNHGYRFHTLSENGEPNEAVPAGKMTSHNHLCLPF